LEILTFVNEVHFEFAVSLSNIIAIVFVIVKVGKDPASSLINYLFDSLQFIPNYYFMTPNFIHFNFMCLSNYFNS